MAYALDFIQYMYLYAYNIKERNMRTKTFVLAILFLGLGLGTVLAEPESNEKCCTPQPVGGIRALSENTIYPLTAERSRLEGDVVVNFLVDESGTVSDVSILKSAVFDESAMDAITSTPWTPARQNGEPVSVVYSQEFKYRVD